MTAWSAALFGTRRSSAGTTRPSLFFQIAECW